MISYEVHSVGDNDEPVVFHAAFDGDTTHPDPRDAENEHEISASEAARLMAADLHAMDGERYVVFFIVRQEIARFG